ncbi:MAG: radical SAM protein [Candidatus Omnitrophica bacterium]|nr:radical SAM protein [Candidatus Omnitrophota bacterium]
MEGKIVFGPVPSRRLGQSLGINNIPPKICSYSCLYCQIGRTKNFSTERKAFYPVEKILDEVSKTLERLKEKKERIDFLTFVPDGEPTLDTNLGKEIEGLKKLTDIKIAVITNASLLWREDVRHDLKEADLVSLKADVAGNKEAWEKINRPASELDYDAILEGVKKFSAVFKGKLLTETLLVKGINDGEKDIRNTAEFLSGIKPAVAFIGIPTRPPAEKWVMPPDEEKITAAYRIFTEYGLNTELITGGVTGSFGFTGNAENDLLNIVSVHPMSTGQVEDFLKKAGGSWDIMAKLLKEKKIKEIVYLNQKYYLKNFSK